MRLGTYYRAALLDRLGLRGVTGRVLDVGGYDGFWLSNLSSSERVSVDIAPRTTYQGVRYVRGDGVRLPFREDTFDVVFALDVIEHVDDDRGLAAELLRVLRPGGLLIVTTPHEHVRIFPGLLQPWANRRWQHERTSGYLPEHLDALLSAGAPSSVRVRELRTWGFRHLYLPLSALWRVWQGAAEAVARWTALMDSREREGPNGYLLAEVIK